MDPEEPRSGQRERRRPLRAFVALGKLGIIELWLGFFAGVSLLGRWVFHEGHALVTLGLVLLLGVVVIAVTCGLDDIAGARDGVDRANHRAGRRWGVQKPILDGRLDEGLALDLVHAATVVGAMCYAGVLAVAWPLPWWLVAAMTAMIVLAVNYSYGLRLSYRGAGELVVFAGGFGTVMIPYALVTRSVTPPLLVSATLVGLWQAQVVMFSNTHDAEGDRAHGRMTIAARTSPGANKAFITAVFAAGWAFTAVALAISAAPLVYALALFPVWALQIFQLWTGVRDEQWLRARRAGFHVVRVGVFGLTLANLASGG